MASSDALADLERYLVTNLERLQAKVSSSLLAHSSRGNKAGDSARARQYKFLRSQRHLFDSQQESQFRPSVAPPRSATLRRGAALPVLAPVQSASASASSASSAQVKQRRVQLVSAPIQACRCACSREETTAPKQLQGIRGQHCGLLFASWLS